MLPRAVLALYDTLRARRARLRPRDGAATLYVCGVTPYDTTHLGHARTFLVFDVLVRHLEARGVRVRYAQNVTDVDESILQRATLHGEDWRDLGAREERAFLQDMGALGWRRPNVMPHATREVATMVELAERLVARGRAYTLPDGGAYYAVRSFRGWGALSRLAPVRMRGILAQQDDTPLDDPRKRDALDFALWRRVASGPTWPSPFGRGRPGWHLECSAMARRHLGHPIDIHGGGADLVYPHHESERAQSEGAYGAPFVRHWMHVGLVRLAANKMSKSTGNMVFVRDVLRRIHPDGLRLFLLATHYRRPLDYDEVRLAQADALATEVRALARIAAAAAVPREALRALDDDLDTPAAIRLLRRLSRARDPRTVALGRYLGMTLAE